MKVESTKRERWNKKSSEYKRTENEFLCVGRWISWSSLMGRNARTVFSLIFLCFVLGDVPLKCEKQISWKSCFDGLGRLGCSASTKLSRLSLIYLYHSYSRVFDRACSLKFFSDILNVLAAQISFRAQILMKLFVE